MNRLITKEPEIKVGVIEQRREVAGTFKGPFRLENGCFIEGDFRACRENDQVILFNSAGTEVARKKEIRCLPVANSTCILLDVTIGIHFHWERKQVQEFCGGLILKPDGSETLTVVNVLPLEDYLESVISSEMSAEAPIEFLKAHAITSRSWIVAMLQSRLKVSTSPVSFRGDDEIIRSYGRVAHHYFDVCADDHCQRYQGITRLISENARNAVLATRGLFLIHNHQICDARYHKACGGLTDNFRSAWENISVPYLTSISDSDIMHPPICDEKDAQSWIMANPKAYCNTRDGKILKQILPVFDQETSDFFRWKMVYSSEELKKIIQKKSGIDFGNILNMEAVERGPSGRIVRLKIEGSKRTIIVGKELEIRRWLSRTHLYSSAFIVATEHNESGNAISFTLHGAGWGHGVGLCQIGAAVMAAQGFSANDILKHYFRDAEIKKLY